MQESLPPDFKIWLNTVRSYQKISRKLAELLRPIDITTAQLDILANLLRHSEGLTQKALVDRLLVTKGNVSGLLERLVGRGLVERRVNPSDARSKMVHLTDLGQTVATQAVTIHRQFVDNLMEVLSDREKEELAEVMSRVEERIESL